MRGQLQGLRREVHFAPAFERKGVDALPCLQKAGSENHFIF